MDDGGCMIRLALSLFASMTWVFFLMALPHSALANDADQYRLLGEKLETAGMHELAVREYARSFALTPTSNRADSALALLRVYYGLGQYDVGLRILSQHFASDESCGRVCPKIALWRLKYLITTDQLALADPLITDFLMMADDPERSQFLLVKGLIKLNSEPHIIPREIEQSASLPGHIGEDARRIVKQIKSKPIKTLRPETAGLLSIIPGLGQAYSGHYTQGAIVFFLNAGVAALAHDSFRKARTIDHYGDGSAIVWTAAFLSFYTGNIYNAMDLASQSNRNHHEQFMFSARQGVWTTVLQP